MSAHVQEQLWAHARGQLGTEEAAKVEAHLRSCTDCARVLEQFRAAVMVVKPAEPPALDDAAWKRIDHKVMDAARKELGRSSPLAWLFEGWKPFVAFGAVAAALVAVLLLWPKGQPVHTPEHGSELPTPIAQQQPQDVQSPQVQDKLLPVQQPPMVAQNEQPAPTVQVASASKLKVDKTAAEKGGSVRVGQKLETEAGGLAFLALPDGSKAGVLGKSALQLNAASLSDVKLSLDRGTLLVAAAHAGPERKFAVEAGQVEVTVMGTRFLVERDDRVTVVVEEGRVEVSAGGQKHHVAAGETLIVETNGKVTRRKSVTPAARAAFRALSNESPRTTAGIKASAAEHRLSDADTNDQAELPVQGGSVVAGQDAGVNVALKEPTPPPLVLPGSDVGANGPPPPEQHFDFLAALKKIDLRNVNLDSPFPPPGMPMAEYRVHQLRLAADRGQCERVVERSDAWLNEFGNDKKTKDLAVLKKAVLFTKARCLSKLGRAEEATKVRIEAESVR